jgi:hypothetical protein
MIQYLELPEETRLLGEVGDLDLIDKKTVWNIN